MFKKIWSRSAKALLSLYKNNIYKKSQSGVQQSPDVYFFDVNWNSSDKI
jgi:hypothetical protein